MPKPKTRACENGECAPHTNVPSLTILSSTEFFKDLYGAREFSTYTLLSRLASNHQIHSIFLGSKNDNWNENGINIHERTVTFEGTRTYIPNTLPSLQMIYLNWAWKKILRIMLKKILPQLILTELGFAPASVNTAAEYDVRVIFFVRSYEHFCPKEFINGFEKCLDHRNCESCWQCDEKRHLPYALKKLHELHLQALRRSDLVLSNSYYVQKVVKLWTGVESEVVYPFIDLRGYYVTRRKQKYILFVGPNLQKGGQVFLKVARRLPRRRFIVCGGGSPAIVKELRKMQNVVYIPWAENMYRIYSQTRLLIVPSLWPEPFGRVTIESMINGIPCIVSSRGGLPEAVGDAGIIINDPYDIDLWINQIQELDDEVNYQTHSDKSEQQAKRFSFENTYSRFTEFVQSHLNFSL
jgi:glycosyltransferase involved in cell wall biosynthesis